MWTLLTIFCFVLRARAEGWDAFTNNLATDLAPLVSLFGEQVTKQFLSESTSPLDNIIFAIAPLGILTAVVSVIRVLGSASLRAFVGRAQEGRGQAEAELCSSTSYDVCELWNNGGIARVFGRPQILEFIFDEEETEKGKKRKVPEETEKVQEETEKVQEETEKVQEETEKVQEEQRKSHRISLVFYELFSGGKVVSRPTAGIYKPEEYQKTLQPVAPAPRPNDSCSHDDARTQFAPNPNLSLNVGIQMPRPIALYGATIFGCLLQASVLGYGAWAIYIKGLRKEGQSATDAYFWLTVTGTLLLVAGMFLCAWLIEQSTQERTFELRKQVFWLQPGNQRVGDQNFEAFAYSTNLQKYTTSWKEEKDKGAEWRKRVLVWPAISTSMVGFVMQFTGLRGLHSSVAMYQFTATLIMALVRSLLRTQRLKESKNLLQARELQGQVEGHELDWQTLRIEEAAKRGPSDSTDSHTNPSGDEPSDGEPYWSIIEKPPKVEGHKIIKFKEAVDRLKTEYAFTANEDGNAAWTSCLQTSAGNQDEWDGKCANALVKWIASVEGKNPGENPTNACEFQSPNVAKKLLCYRSRLSYLTNDGAPTTAQRWGLAVREQAIKLQKAIQSVANYVFSDACQAEIRAEWGATAAFCWAMNCDTGRRPAEITALPIHLMVRRIRGQWRIDICQLEAVLGLWIWSIKMEVEKGKEERRKDENHEKKEIDYDLIFSRKIFTVVPNRDSEALKQAERELNLWVLREKRQPVYDTLDELAPAESETSKPRFKRFSSLSLPVMRKLLISNLEHQQNQQRQDIRLLSVQTENSVLVMATQDIFTSFIDALASITSELKGVNIVQSLRSDAVAREVISTSKAQPFLGLAHNHTEHLVDLFTQAGLGSREDALMSVIPSFHMRSLLPSLMAEHDRLKSLAWKLRREGRWAQAQDLLMALYDDAMTSREDETCRSEELFRELGELYRKAMRSDEQSHRDFGYRGVCEMLELHTEETKRIKDIKQNYSWVAIELAKIRNDNTIPGELHARFNENGDPSQTEMTLQGAMGLELAYPVGLVMAEKFKEEIKNKSPSTEPTLLIWAAQKGCEELVDDLIDARLNINISDKQRRTPLSYSCEEGHVEVAKRLLNEGATITTDQDERTPLSWAAGKGYKPIVELLLDINKATVEWKDKNGWTPLSWATEGEHKTVVELLLKAGATADCEYSVVNNDVCCYPPRVDRVTPLCRAAGKGYEAVVKLLLNLGEANVNWKDKNGWTPLSWATEVGHKTVVELLLKAGATADCEYRLINPSPVVTPLYQAAGKGCEAIVKLLLDLGKANVDWKDLEGSTPLSLARERGHWTVVELLLKAGATAE